jgi:chitinase
MAVHATVRTTLPASPVEITTGGTYRGWWRSTNPATPAVTISTTAPVAIVASKIDHAGFGIWDQATVGANLTVTDTVLRGLNPGSSIEARAVYLLQPASFIFEHNYLVDGQGVLVNGNNVSCNPLRIRYNDYVDIGRWNSPVFVGAVHFDQVLASNGAEIAWNRVTNHYGRSVCEDVIGLHESHGASGNRIEVHHNLIDGSYPYTGDGASFTGGGIDLGDGDTTGGTWQYAHDNTVVRVTNNGLMIPAGTDLEYEDNRAVTSGIADSGDRVSSTFGNGLNLWDNPSYAVTPARASMHDNVGDHRRWTGSAWERSWQNTSACDPGGACTGNTNAGLDLNTDAVWLAEINDALADWETARSGAGVTVGVR